MNASRKYLALVTVSFIATNVRASQVNRSFNTPEMSGVSLSPELATQAPNGAARESVEGFVDGFTQISQPTADYTSRTTLFAVTEADFAIVTSYTDAATGCTVTFTPPLQARTVPGSWQTWGSPPDTESATPRILYTQGASSVTLAFTGCNPTTAGFEAEPNPFTLNPMTATFYSGTTQLGAIMRDVSGSAGARLFAADIPSSFDRIVFSAPVDFAISQVRFAMGGGGPALFIGFEPPDYNGSADGVTVTGQQGWYLPAVQGSADEFVYTYDGNVLNLSPNPTGETQFLGGLVVGDRGELRRAQLDFDWSTSSVWTVSYDLAARWNGTLPAVDNIGSFSLQDSLVARYFIALNTWTNPDLATMWSAKFVRFFADGTAGDPTGDLPAPAWANLAVDHWYRESITFDFSSNTIVTVAITDLDTGETLTANPTGWYLAGGATPTLPMPTALRFFIGGDTITTGNTMGWDNLQIDAVAGGAVVVNPAEAPRLQVTPNVSERATN